jgi:hypothetical protein
MTGNSSGPMTMTKPDSNRSHDRGRRQITRGSAGRHAGVVARARDRVLLVVPSVASGSAAMTQAQI